MSVGSKWNRYGTCSKGLTDQHCQECFDQLYMSIQDLLPLEQHDSLMLNEEDLLIKFLMARNYNVPDAENMLRNYIKWRNSYGTNLLLTSATFPEMFSANSDVGFSGHDREGHPIYIEFPKGKLALELLKTQPFEEIFRWHNVIMERQREVLKHWRMDQIDVIIDMKGLTTSCYTSPVILSVLKKFSQHDQANYPEILRHFFCINAPVAASGLWKAFSPFLDPTVRDKVHIWGPKEWPEQITKYVDVAGLPERLGGQATDWYPITPNLQSYRLPPPPTTSKQNDALQSGKRTSLSV